jgi:flagellin
VQAQKGNKEQKEMALTVLNNISSMTAENALANTQANLQKTLQQLSTGMKINSGSDDAAGLSIVSGLTANIAALTQSQQNASNGIGMLQTADGALSQVTTLLNRAVTLATEGSTAGITASQSSALDTEYQSIVSEINQIGQATNFNGTNVFSSNAPVTFTSTQGSTAVPLTVSAALTANSLLTNGSVTTITDGTGTLTFTAKTGDTVGTLQAAITAAAAGGTLKAATTSAFVNGALVITDGSGGTGISAVTSTDAQLGAAFTVGALGAGNTATTKNNVAGPVLTNGSVTTIQDSGTGGTFSFTAKTGESINDLVNAIKDAVTSGTLSPGVTASVDGAGQLLIGSNSSTDSIKVVSNDAALGAMNADTPSFVSASATALTSASVITSGSVITINYANSSTAATFTATAATTVGNLLSAINTGTGTGITVANRVANTTAQINAGGQFEIDASNGDISSAVTSGTASVLGNLSAINGSSNTSTVYLGDGTTAAGADTDISTTIGALNGTALGLTGNLQSTATSQTSLAAITSAINTISAQRGVIGASVNRLTAATNNLSSEVTNLQSAVNSLQNADIGKTVANMTQYNVLQSTGMAALQQSNQAQQAVLKLVQ